MSQLTAYIVGQTRGWVLEPASRKRDWMAKTPHAVAHRCLPLVVASQAGWVINCPVSFKVTWNGKNPPQDSIKFEFQEHAEQYGRQIVSNFGSGIVTFSLPWLFRTDEGMATLVRGPTNSFKEHIAPLDGLVETDWVPSTFTMNWKILKPKTAIWFRKGEPICMIAPYPIALLEQMQTSVRPLHDDPELEALFNEWKATRNEQFRQAERQGGDPTGAFNLDYVRGAKPDGTFAKAHWSNLKLGRFDSPEE